MKETITKHIDEALLVQLVGTQPYYFDSPFITRDLRFPYYEFREGKLVFCYGDWPELFFGEQTGFGHYKLSFGRCAWHEIEPEGVDFHEMMLSLERCDGTDHSAGWGENADGNVINGTSKIFMAPAPAIDKIAVYEKQLRLAEIDIHYDAFIVFSYGENACIVGTQNTVHGMMKLFFVKADEVAETIAAQTPADNENYGVDMAVRERIVLQ